jgi:nucleoside-diphosphate-sugar epimerase
VRPSHTYDETLFPFHGGYTIIDRMLRGKPVIVHGDGTSLWTLTHHDDFARGFVGLLGNPHAIGAAVHITSDEWLSWNQIFETYAHAAGVAQPQLVHVPSDLIAAYDPEWGASLLGDKTHSMVFDNTKIKRLVPDFAASIPLVRGAAEALAWYNADLVRCKVDPAFDALCDRIIAAMLSAYPKG